MFVTEILRDALAKVERYERENPDDARSIARCLEAFKFQINGMILHIEQPTAMDLEDLTEEIETGTRH